MNSRTAFCKLVLVISLGLFLTSCGVPMTKGQIWLDSKKDDPQMNVSGTWTSREWGTARFKQEGRNVEGVLGDYPVKGVVSGKTIYLLMYSGTRVDYSAELTLSDDNTFQGFYSKYSIVGEVETTSKRKMSLKLAP